MCHKNGENQVKPLDKEFNHATKIIIKTKIYSHLDHLQVAFTVYLFAVSKK